MISKRRVKQETIKGSYYSERCGYIKTINQSCCQGTYMLEVVDEGMRSPLGVRRRLLQVDGSNFPISGEHLFHFLLTWELGVDGKSDK